MSRSDLLDNTPGAVERLGEALFVKAPLYRAQKTFVPLYINAALYRRYISNVESSWQEMSDVLSELFSVTLDKSAATEQQVGFAYVDRQYDPLMFATRGNAGSGRAYYLGKHFNMKGEKTPLCTSDHPRYSDGVLAMERGVWETYISNVLDGDIDIGVPPVIAVLDVGETCYVESSQSNQKRVRIIRIDDHGALDRITHVFAAKKTLNAGELQHTAQQFGKQEGEKFISRIMYGAWSSGNITPNGDMLDFDTVCTVKGRSPQYSASAWHNATYFGYEIYGQLQILKALATDSIANADHLPFETLENDCLQARKDQIAKRFLYLAGFEHADQLHECHRVAVEKLADDFTSLAQKFYPKLPSLSLRDSGSYLFHVFDFSAFFRAYPLLKRTSNFSVEKSLQLMMETTLLPFPLERKELYWTAKEDLTYFEENAWKSIREHCVTDAGILEKDRRLAAEFIESYDALFEVILSGHDINMLEVEARAYVINEDRLYLYPCFTPTSILSENKAELSPEQQSESIDRFIAASKRKPMKNDVGEYQADVRVFNEGMYCVYLDDAGHHKKCLSLSASTPWLKKLGDNKNVYLKIDGRLQEAEISYSGQYVNMIVARAENASLLPDINRDNSLIAKTIMVLHEENVYRMNNYLEN